MSRSCFFGRRTVALTSAVAASVLMAWGQSAWGQADWGRANVVRTPLDSGVLGNDKAEPKVVFSRIASVPGGAAAAPWMRLVFDRLDLAEGSFVRITSLTDGDAQVLDAAAAAEWGNTTAYFNGGAVLVELIAGPGTTANSVVLSRSVAGMTGGVTDRRVCDSVDNRTASNDARVARLLSVTLPLPQCPGELPCGSITAGLCSAEIIDVPLADNAMDRVLVSAGHCFNAAAGGGSRPMTVAQFGPVPDTDPTTCDMRMPAVAKQFAVNSARLRYNDPGDCGNDWAVFACCKNPTTMKTVFEEQNAAFTLAPAAPADGAAISKVGFGADGPATARYCDCVPGHPESAKNATQQTSAGTVTAVVGVDWVIRHNCHTCGGDSGCALIDGMGRLVGIHTAGQCQPNPTPPRNCGAVITNPNLQAAIAAVAAALRPLNDDCVNAAPVANGIIPYSTKDATTDGPVDFRFVAALAGPRTIEKDVWFRYDFAGAAAANVRFSICNSTFDTRLALYDNACPTGPDTALAVADDSPGCGTRSELVFMCQPNTSYLVRVGGYDGASGTGTLEISTTAPPANDVCNAMVRFAGVGANPFNTGTATTDGPAEPACPGGTIGQDVWFRFLACATGSCRIETCGATAFDTCLAVYNFDAAVMPCPRGALIAADDNGCGRQSRVDIDVQAGTVYLIRIGGAGTAHGTGMLFIHPIEPENDDCNDATVVGAGRVLFDLRGATTDGPNPTTCFSPCEKDVWYFYTYAGAANATIVFETCDFATDFDTVLVLYAGTDCPPMGMESHCSDDDCARASRIVVNNVAPGDDFVIRVGVFREERAGCGALRITPSADLSPPNNAACTFWHLPEGVTPFSTVGATTDGANPVGCLPMTFNQDIEHDTWYRFITTTAGNLVVDACDADFDARLAGYDVRFTGGGALICPPTAAAVACGDDDCGAGGTRPIMNVPIPVDANGDPTRDLWVRVGGFNDGVTVAEGSGNLKVRVLPNDNCAAARFNRGRIGVGDGDNAFDNTGARTDGPVLGAACDAMNMASADLWFLYTAGNGGNTTFACTTAYNNFIAVHAAPLVCDVPSGNYLLGCPAGAPVQCNHANAAVGPNKRSTVTVMTTAGTEYWVRVGGFGAGQWGPGTLTITPQPAGPENDNCWNPRPAELGSNPFSTVGATTDGPATPMGCTPDNQIHQDVWFSYVPPMNGNLVVETCGGPAAFDTRIAVYTEPADPPCPPAAGPPPVLPAVCGTLNLVANSCNDNSTDPACAPRSRVNIIVTRNVFYRIRIGGVNNMTGSGILTLRFIMNDRCVTAKQIQPGGGANYYLSSTVLFDSTGANTDGAVVAAPCDGFADNQINQDLWYNFAAPRRGRLTLDTIGSTFDTKLAVYDGGGGVNPACPPPAAFIACNDDIGGGNTRSRVALDVMGGNNYLIRVGGYLSQQGPGRLNVMFIDNDACEGFRSATDGMYNFDTRGASPGGIASCADSNMAPDVWFRYRATCTGDLIADTCVADYDTVLTVHNDNCMALLERACNDDDLAVHCAGLYQSYVTVPVVAGDDHFIRIAGYQMQSGTGVLHLRCVPTGACCAGSICLILRPSECTGAARRFVGPSTVCNAPNNFTTPCCMADYNQNGIVSVQDIFDYLMAYFGSDATADIDGGGLGVSDIFAFLAAYFAGCS